jgi:hypothetical protein
MADIDNDTSDPKVTDRTTRPAGVMNQSAKTWVMLAVAIGLVALMTLSGATKPREDPRGLGAERAPVASDPAVLSDMQARLDAATTAPHQSPVQAPVVPERDVADRDTAGAGRTQPAPDRLAEGAAASTVRELLRVQFQRGVARRDRHRTRSKGWGR